MTEPAGSARHRLAPIVLVLTLLGFVLLSAAVLSGATDTFDRAVVLSLREAAAIGPSGAPRAGEFMAEMTAIGGKAVLGLLGLLLAGLLALLRRWRDLSFLAASMLGGLELSGFFKSLFGRVRPDLVAHMVREDSLSYPSGHATYSAIACTAFALLLWRVLPGAAARAYITAAAALLVLLVGISRVYLGVHYPSDVLAGWCLGIAWALACWLAVERLAGR